MKTWKPGVVLFAAAALFCGRSNAPRQPVIGPAVESIEKADFLTAKPKRDILYNNAARFLRLAPEQIAEHHGASMK